MQRYLSLLLLLVLLFTSCSTSKPVDQQNVFYYAGIYGSTEGEIQIRLSTDGLLEIYGYSPSVFSKGGELTEQLFAEKLDSKQFADIALKIENLEECRKERKDGSGYSTAWRDVFSIANGTTYEFRLGSDVNVWHSYVVRTLLEIAQVKY